MRPLELPPMPLDTLLDPDAAVHAARQAVGLPAGARVLAAM